MGGMARVSLYERDAVAHAAVVRVVALGALAELRGGRARAVEAVVQWLD